MPDFTVREYGTDTSGRPLLMTAYLHDWWERVCDELGFVPTVVQGAFMARIPGGGAAASAGYHDAAGCLDLRTWDRTAVQVQQIIRTTRRLGAASWVRDERHGMDPHIHLVLGADFPLANGAAWQWESYLAGRDGLSSGGRDYHWRPDPLVTEPPEDTMNPAQERKLDEAIARLEAVDKKVTDLRKVEAQRFKKVIVELRGQGKTDGEILAAVEALSDDA